MIAGTYFGLQIKITNMVRKAWCLKIEPMFQRPQANPQCPLVLVALVSQTHETKNSFWILPEAEYDAMGQTGRAIYPCYHGTFLKQTSNCYAQAAYLAGTSGGKFQLSKPPIEVPISQHKKEIGRRGKPANWAKQHLWLRCPLIFSSRRATVIHSNISSFPVAVICVYFFKN